MADRGAQGAFLPLSSLLRRNNLSWLANLNHSLGALKHTDYMGAYIQHVEMPRCAPLSSLVSFPYIPTLASNSKSP
jgi:hypothetical protein